MPTGYTARIIDGEITNFKDFAKLCTRAFGASIHMREESLDTPYREDVVDDYYIDDVNEYEEKLKNLKNKSLDEIVSKHKKILEEEIDDYKKEVVDRQKLAPVFNKLIKEAKEFVAPTENHQNFKNFVIDQLEKTNDSDIDTTYYDERILSLEHQLKNLNPEILREMLISDAEKSLERAKNRLKEQEELVKERNQWNKDIFDILNQLN